MQRTQSASLLPILSVPGTSVYVKLAINQSGTTRAVLLKVSIDTSYTCTVMA